MSIPSNALAGFESVPGDGSSAQFNNPQDCWGLYGLGIEQSKAALSPTRVLLMAINSYMHLGGDSRTFIQVLMSAMKTIRGNKTDHPVGQHEALAIW